MRFTWILAASLLFAGSVFADDENGKTDGKSDGKSGTKVESKSIAKVTMVVIDEDGKVIEKRETAEAGTDNKSRVKVEVVDGRQVVEVTLPDGTKKKIDINAGREGGPAGRVMRWVFRNDGDNIEGSEKLAEVKERVEKIAKEVDLDVKIDAESIAEQVKGAMKKIKPLMLEEKEIGGEMLLEFSDLAFLIHEDEDAGEAAEDGETKSTRQPKRIQVQRISAADRGLSAVLKKLDELSQRLEKIESRLDELSKD